MFKFLILILLIASIHGDLDDFSMPNYSSALSRVIIDYMVNYMAKISPVINLFQISHSNNTIDQLYIMNEVMYHTNKERVIHRIFTDVNEVDGITKKIGTRKRHHNVILVDSCKSFDLIFVKINIKQWRVQGNYIIAITRYAEDIYACMMQVFGDFWSKHIFNVVIMFPTQAQNEVLLYTFYPFSAFYCERAIPIQLNQYRGNKFLNKIDYFPEKLNNFHNCNLSVATHTIAPFMMYNKDNETGAVTVDGIEGTLLRVLSQRLNFNVDPYISPQASGYIYENGTVTGRFKIFLINYLI